MKNAIISTGEWKGVVFLSLQLIKRQLALFRLKPSKISFSSVFKKISDLHVSPYEFQPQQHICIFPNSLHKKFSARKTPLKKVKITFSTILNILMDSLMGKLWIDFKEENKFILRS